MIKDIAKILDQIDLEKIDLTLNKEMHAIRAKGEAGGGLVKVEMDGQKRVHAIEIDDLVLKEGKPVLMDLLIAAFNKTAEEVEEKIKEATMKAVNFDLSSVEDSD